jgi:hypothetical protein
MALLFCFRFLPGGPSDHQAISSTTSVIHGSNTLEFCLLDGASIYTATKFSLSPTFVIFFLFPLIEGYELLCNQKFICFAWCGLEWTNREEVRASRKNFAVTAAHSVSQFGM